MEHGQLKGAIEAILFVVGEPISPAEIKRIFSRLWINEDAEWREHRLQQLPAIIDELKESWALPPVSNEKEGMSGRGFGLVEVSDGLAFRSNPAFAEVLRSMQAQRPVRLSRAALETLAIIAYRQPVTKPEIDHIRGVDCGGTIRLLLARRLVRIMGKKDEPGRPLIYGTTKEFLSFFNLRSLSHLPTLKEFGELSPEAVAELEGFDGLLDIEELRQSASTQLKISSEPSIEALDEAVQTLKMTQRETRDALAAEGIEIDESDPEVTQETRMDAALSDVEGQDGTMEAAAAVSADSDLDGGSGPADSEPESDPPPGDRQP